LESAVPKVVGIIEKKVKRKNGKIRIRVARGYDMISQQFIGVVPGGTNKS